MVNERQKELLSAIKSYPQDNRKVELIVELLATLVNANTKQAEAWKEFHENIKSLKREEDVKDD